MNDTRDPVEVRDPASILLAYTASGGDAADQWLAEHRRYFPNIDTHPSFLIHEVTPGRWCATLQGMMACATDYGHELN